MMDCDYLHYQIIPSLHFLTRVDLKRMKNLGKMAFGKYGLLEKWPPTNMASEKYGLLEIWPPRKNSALEICRGEKLLPVC